MNERIKQLYDQAIIIEDGGDYVCGELDPEKFAQLIVQECVGIASEVRGEPATDTHYVIGYDRACEKMISGIREHFGVEDRAVPILSADEQALFAGIASSKLFTIEGAKKQFGVEE